MTDTVGSVGTPETFTVAGANLTGNITVTAPTNFLVSTNGATFTSSVTLTESGGTVSTAHVYVQIASTAPAGGIGPVNAACTSTGATTQNVAVSGTVYSGSMALDSIRVYFTDSTNEHSQSGWTAMAGDIAHNTSISATGGNSNSITVTALKANWAPVLSTGSFFDFTCSYPNTGLCSTIVPWAPSVGCNCWYSYGQTTFSQVNTTAQLAISGLIAGRTYNLRVGATSNGTFYSAIPDNQVANLYAGSSSIGYQGPDSLQACSAGGTENTTTYKTFSSVTADSGGNIYIGMPTDLSQSAAVISWFILKQTD
jgi:hypothetical protein